MHARSGASRLEVASAPYQAGKVESSNPNSRYGTQVTTGVDSGGGQNSQWRGSPAIENYVSQLQPTYSGPQGAQIQTLTYPQWQQPATNYTSMQQLPSGTGTGARSYQYQMSETNQTTAPTMPQLQQRGLADYSQNTGTSAPATLAVEPLWWQQHEQNQQQQRTSEYSVGGWQMATSIVAPTSAAPVTQQPPAYTASGVSSGVGVSQGPKLPYLPQSTHPPVYGAPSAGVHPQTTNPPKSAPPLPSHGDSSSANLGKISPQAISAPYSLQAAPQPHAPLSEGHAVVVSPSTQLVEPELDDDPNRLPTFIRVRGLPVEHDPRIARKAPPRRRRRNSCSCCV